MEELGCGQIKKLWLLERIGPVLCELCYVLLEYTRTAVFVWMLLEGIHLHTSIVVVFPNEVKFVFFHCIGWGE
ncbi:hypothetical protein CDAR_374181 [Caerostris darwini]|uniref:G-protein coupled receptors family 2 profile 2 domain-containing protein n=1 Tax=Caerostris darwini TaxID=1538125 RepID=A0AAV4S8C5_9ARAC|nr:hypothetical protein CDAR_374181 [Caerostris darwini]